ncbi:histidinol dehydrogenase [bacterium]|nr:MAG: histidinol dehydrogenase [bacterium]
MIPFVLSADLQAALAKRTASRDEETRRGVAETIEDVRQRGDAALLDSARRFDSPALASIRVTEEEISAASVSAEVEAALKEALWRIATFHTSQLTAITDGWKGDDSDEALWDFQQKTDRKPLEWYWNRAAVGTGPLFRKAGFYEGSIGQKMLALGRAGIYVPGGNAAYPSSVLMNALPGRLVGTEIAMTSPTREDGTWHPAVLVAMRLAGISEGFKVGGAAAIAALALGTESISRVDKIVGPGNRWVNEAKRQLWGTVGLDGYAGPSEVCVVADDQANAAFAAADLLTQIEHAPDNCAFLVTLSEGKRNEIVSAIEQQLAGAPRAETMRQALAENSFAVIAQDRTEALDIVNQIAPEHLSLVVGDPEAWSSGVKNAGCILIGEHTPESAGDYVAGPSHTLPTAGAARWQSPVSVQEFLKLQSVIRLSANDLKVLAPSIVALAEAEGFPAHGAGASLRGV